ncbi:cation:proton antiporter, partial [Corynebacterium striatum]
MTLLYVVLLAALAVVLAPVTVRVADRAAGYPLAGIFVVAAVLLAKEFGTLSEGKEISFSRTWVRDVVDLGIDVNFALRGDALGVFFAMLALVIGAVVFTYS